jgi:hypothetical protein
VDLSPNPFIKRDNGDDSLKAYRIAVDIKFDLARAEISITSWNMHGFQMIGADLFDLLERAPGTIAEWFHDRYGVEVAVIPMHSTFNPADRRVDDGYVVIPMRSIVAAVRDLEPKR